MSQAISSSEWGRTLLTRQHLSVRVDDDAIEVIDRCVGLQSQDPQAAFFALAARVVNFDPAELDRLLTQRDVVRMALWRSTVWLADTEDARWIRPLAQPTLDAELTRVHARRLDRADPSVVVAAARELLTDREWAGSALGQALAEQFGGENPSTLTAVARCALPLVQVPPRGMWGRGGAARYRLFDEWAGAGDPAVTGDEARADLIRMYLRGFGPATMAAIQTWAGMTRLRPLVEAMERDWEVNRLTGPDGEELFDLDGLDVTADADAPARLLAPYDTVLMANADRRRIVDDRVFASLQTPNGRMPGTVLVDGRIVGRWSLGETGVEVDYLADVPGSRRAAVDGEAEALTDFCGSGSAGRWTRARR